MGHFLRVLMQFSIIGLIAVVPIVMPGHWLILSIVCAFVVFGLLLFGIFNPAHALKRMIVWGGAACIAGGLGYGDPRPITDALKHAGLHENFADVLYAVLSVFFNPSLSYLSVVALGLLVMLEIAPIVIERILSGKEPDTVTVRPATALGVMSVGPATRIDFRVAVTNAGPRDVTVTGAHLILMRWFTVTPILYSEQIRPTEIAQNYPLRVGVNESVTVEIIALDLNKWLVHLASLFAFRPLVWITDLSATVKFDGDGSLPEVPTALRFKVHRLLPNQTQAAPTM